jgi:catechol 2,3-dioxygenase-like lactoylglutathione lyase family enzyme
MSDTLKLAITFGAGGLGAWLALRRASLAAKAPRGAIVPCLLVRDLQASLRFYRDLLGFKLVFTVDGAKGFADKVLDGAVFASLSCACGEIMLQSVGSFAEDLPSVFSPASVPQASGTLYMRCVPGLDASDVITRVPAEHVVKGRTVSWYGMNELYVKDPDGHILCFASPEGRPPSAS